MTSRRTIPSLPSVNVPGLLSVHSVVVAITTTPNPHQASHGPWSTCAVPPTRCDEDNAASMHPYGVCDNAEPGPMRQRREGLFPARIAPKFLGQLQECQGRSHDTGQPQACNPLTESQLSATVAPPAKQRARASQEMHVALRDALLASIVTTDPTVLHKSSSTFSSLSLRGRNRAIMAHVACFRQRYRKAPCLAHGPLWARGG